MTWTKDMPDWRKTYKNRKKTIRRAYQAGKITAAERERLQAEAHAACGSYTAQSLAYRMAAAKGSTWRESGGQSTCGNDVCLGAEMAACRCECGGVGHGVAKGINPWEVRPLQPGWLCGAHHGTVRGWRRHRLGGEDACDACQDAWDRPMTPDHAELAPVGWRFG